MNIPENLTVAGLEEIGISRGHLRHCIDPLKFHIDQHVDYYGTHVSRGWIVLDTKVGPVKLVYDECDNWIRSASVEKVNA